MELRFERKLKISTKKNGIVVIPKKMRNELSEYPEGTILKVLIATE